MYHVVVVIYQSPIFPPVAVIVPEILALEANILPSASTPNFVPATIRQLALDPLVPIVILPGQLVNNPTRF
jgi:hypothetical protein